VVQAGGIQETCDGLTLSRALTRLIFGIAMVSSLSFRGQEPAWERVRAWAEYQDIPFALAKACWEAERGVKGYDFGQISYNWDVKALAEVDEQQMAQAMRTLRRGWIGFRRENPWIEEHYAKLNPKSSKEKSDQAMMWQYRTRFVHYLAFTGWAPEESPEVWEKNVMFWWTKEHERSNKRG